MASRDFGLVKYEVRRVDGTGETYTAYQTPSAYIRATRHDELDFYEMGVLMAYYAVRAAGILGALGVDVSHRKTDLDRALALFDVYTFREVLLDDEGNELDADEEDEPDPTGPRSRASAS